MEKRRTVVHAEERFLARTKTVARDEGENPPSAVHGPHTDRAAFAAAMNPAAPSSPHQRPPSEVLALPIRGIPISSTDGLVLQRSRGGAVNVDIYFTVVRAPKSDADVEDYLERFISRGWAPYWMGNPQRIVRVPYAANDPYGMLRLTMNAANNYSGGTDKLRDGFKYFPADPVLFPAR